MVKHMLPRFFLLLTLLILISACATSPIAKQYRVAASEDNLHFPTALCKPDECVGSSVIWGGIIIQTKNLKNGSQIIVLQTSLGSDTRPIDPRDTKGRFIAKSSDFLDPELYQKGREITIAGVIDGKKKMLIGDTLYTYPVVTVKQIYLWEEEKEPFYLYVPHGYWGRGLE